MDAPGDDHPFLLTLCVLVWLFALAGLFALLVVAIVAYSLAGATMSLQQKAIDCLRAASMPIGCAARVRYLDELAAIYSWRALEKKIEELVDRGYIEPLRGGAACGGLTRKGARALRNTEDHAVTS